MDLEALEKLPAIAFKVAVLCAIADSGASGFDSCEFGWKVQEHLEDTLKASEGRPVSLDAESQQPHAP